MKTLLIVGGVIAAGGVGYLVYQQYKKGTLFGASPQNIANPGVADPNSMAPINYVPPKGSEIPGVSQNTFNTTASALGGVAGTAVGGYFGGPVGATVGAKVGTAIGPKAATSAIVGAKAHVSAVVSSVSQAGSGVKDIASGNVGSGAQKILNSAVTAGLAPITSTFSSIKSLF